MAATEKKFGARTTTRPCDVKLSHSGE
jgi:hypothetical protein